MLFYYILPEVVAGNRLLLHMEVGDKDILGRSGAYTEMFFRIIF